MVTLIKILVLVSVINLTSDEFLLLTYKDIFRLVLLILVLFVGGDVNFTKRFYPQAKFFNKVDESLMKDGLHSLNLHDS